jgi:hypothetical protein
MWIVIAFLGAQLVGLGVVAAATCPGDCDDDGAVTVDEILVGVSIALGQESISACEAFDANGDGQVTVDELLGATNNALQGCEAQPGDNNPHPTPVLPNTQQPPPLDKSMHLPEEVANAPADTNPNNGTCMDCHAGIESIGASMSFVTCVQCHKGDNEASGQEAAHAGLLPNPAALDAVGETCGPCHPGVTERMMKGLHATSAGVISGAHYAWGAEDKEVILYAVRAVSDDDGEIPEDALSSLDQIPTSDQSGNHVDDYLRKECLRCHLWTEGKRRDGDYRAAGCAACHVLYADDGLSHSGDPTVPGDEPGHAIKHVVTTKIPTQQCIHCHNRGGRTGVSFIGTMESDGYGSPWGADGNKQPQLHGKNYNHLRPDVHFERGMECIDCHVEQELHGDGNIWGKKEFVTEVRCETCHGTFTEEATLVTIRGNSLPNVEQTEGGDFILTSKVHGTEHPVTQAVDVASVAMSIPGHQERMECTACHAPWAPQCYGCHAKRDDRQEGYDWIAESNQTGKWNETRSYLRWQTPVLGINVKGKVSPFVPGCQVFFTHVDETGTVVEHNVTFTTTDGVSGIAHSPLQPHTISADPRICADCHMSRKALGLGTGIYRPLDNGLGIDFELEQIVREDGTQIQANLPIGARPFTQEEMERISRAGTCANCHEQ